MRSDSALVAEIRRGLRALERGSAKLYTLDALLENRAHVPERRLRVPGDVASLVQGLHPDLKRKLHGALDAIIADPSVGKELRDELAGLRSQLPHRASPAGLPGRWLAHRDRGRRPPNVHPRRETWRRVRRDLSSR